jgi:hypothetical protein
MPEVIRGTDELAIGVASTNSEWRRLLHLTERTWITMALMSAYDPKRTCPHGADLRGSMSESS